MGLKCGRTFRHVGIVLGGVCLVRFIVLYFRKVGGNGKRKPANLWFPTFLMMEPEAGAPPGLYSAPTNPAGVDSVSASGPVGRNQPGQTSAGRRQVVARRSHLHSLRLCRARATWSPIPVRTVKTSEDNQARGGGTPMTIILVRNTHRMSRRQLASHVPSQADRRLASSWKLPCRQYQRLLLWRASQLCLARRVAGLPKCASHFWPLW